MNRSDIGNVVAGLLKKAIKESEKTRICIAAEMSVITGAKITESSINAWTSPSKTNWRFPFEYAPAFERSAETTLLSEFITSLAGGKALFGDEAALVEIIRIQVQIDRLEVEKSSLICGSNKLS